MKQFVPLMLLTLCTPAWAQVFPSPTEESPRIQSVDWQAGQTIVLTALPETALTVMLEPSERIQRVVLTGSQQWDVSISPDDNSFQIKPQINAAPTTLTVETSARQYDFAVEAEESLMAAYVVRLNFQSLQAPVAVPPPEEITGLDWGYRLRGDRSVRPHSIRDNGQKTVIEYAPDQPLPAVFAIGATGDEEVVDGYMRDGMFVIDRVHQRLVFRIDKDKATARRNKRKDGEQ